MGKPRALDKTDVIGELWRLVDDAGSQVAAAGRIGVSTAYLSDVLTGRREPGPKILDALKLVKAFARVES